MRIISINKTNNNNKQPFKQNQNYSVSLGSIIGVEKSVDTFVSNEFNKTKNNKINKISSTVFERFAQNWDKNVEDIEKFQNPYNKALILNNLAHSYHQNGEIEKAGIILAASLNELNKDLGFWEEDKKKLIEKEENITLLKDFFYYSNNITAKHFVMKSLNELNNPKFLPIAEDICECDDDITSINDNKTIYEAREFLNKNYNLNNLKAFFNLGDNYKSAALNIISKWGLEKHIPIAEKLQEDLNIGVKAKADSVVSKLERLKSTSENILVEDDKSSERKKRSKFELKDALKDVNDCHVERRRFKLIKTIGLKGKYIKHAIEVMPKNDEENQENKLRAEAVLKISLKNNITPYLLK